MKKTKYTGTKLSKKSIDLGNIDRNESDRKFLKKHAFGDVYVVSNKTKARRSSEPKKHWYLLYTETGWHTGGFTSKRKAEQWYEGGGR